MENSVMSVWISRLGVTGDEGVGKRGEGRQQVILEEEKWSLLPDDLLDKVLARLPVHILVRMQSVCKRWRIKLRTPSFIRICEDLSLVQPERWLLTFGHMPDTVGLAYDDTRGKWHTLPLSFLPFTVDCKSPLAAADGLVCLGSGWRSLNKGFTPSRLVVCNPLSRFWRDLPLPPSLDPARSLVAVAGIVVDRYAGTYKLVMIGEVTRHDASENREQKLLIAFVFDSVTQLWSAHETMVNMLDPFTTFLASHFRILVGFAIRSVLCSVVCEGVLYCLTSRPYQVHAYNVEQEDWSRFRVSLPAEIRAPLLAGRPGHLFLVGSYLHNQHDKSRNIGIWELDRATLRWVVVDILLETTLCNQGRVKSSDYVKPNDVVLFVKWSAKFLAYNFSQKSWHWLPDCHLCAQSCPPSSTGYLFSPSLLLP